MANYFFICFRSGKCDLNTAARALSGCQLTVTDQEDRLVVNRSGNPVFRISLSAEKWVRSEAEEIGEGTPHAAAMRERDARFEVSFDSLDEVLDEYTTLQIVQEALQEVTQGFLFLGWNGSLVGPQGT